MVDHLSVAEWVFAGPQGQDAMELCMHASWIKDADLDGNPPLVI